MSGNRRRNPSNAKATRAASVCCSITSLTRTAYGSIPSRRHGYLSRRGRYQARTARRSGLLSRAVMPALRELMSIDLISVPPTATVAEAAQVMSLQHVGAALVVDADDLVGIFTERDIVRALAAEHDAATHDVREWMTKDPVTLDADVSASRVTGSL